MAELRGAADERPDFGVVIGESKQAQHRVLRAPLPNGLGVKARARRIARWHLAGSPDWTM